MSSPEAATNSEITPASEPPSTTATSSTSDPPLSKNAIKKAAKAERFAAYKLERRAKEKAKNKEKKAVRAAKRAAGELDEADLKSERQNKKPKTKSSFGGRVVVDLGFDDKMTEKEVTSLCSQLSYTHSANRRAGFPFTLLFSSLDGKTVQKLDGMNQSAHLRWQHTTWWKEDYQNLWAEVPPPVPEENTPQKSISCPKDTVVYLTADSQNELEELKPEETYIIGGLCDHNRYKNICFNKANDHGIRTARLPIGQYISLSTRKVLTVNQAFEILVHWVESKDWEKAFYAVIPKRKFNQPDDDREDEETVKVVKDSDILETPLTTDVQEIV